MARRRSPAPSSDSNQDGAGHTGPEEPAKSKKPANTAFRQQRLRAWQPVLTPRTIIAVWSVLAIVLLATGGVLFWLSSTVRDFTLEYTRCQLDAPNQADLEKMPSTNIVSHFGTTENSSSLDPSIALWRRYTQNTVIDGTPTDLRYCVVQFNVPEALKPPVVMYYKLDNFYQNHRRYVTSFSAPQLAGQALDSGAINASQCEQLHSDPKGSGRPIYPCGLIANSMFNDTYGNPVLLNVQGSQAPSKTYVMDNKTNIAWASERELFKPTAYKNSDVVPPPNWEKRWPKGYTDANPIPNLQDWPQFQNWMRTAATAVFAKPYQRNDVDTLGSGTYQLEIRDEFNVTAFDGRKFFVITTLSALGGRNPWIGIIFLVTGGFCLIMAIVFSVGHLLRPRKMGDHTYLSWNNVPNGAAAGAATGPTSGAQPVRSGTLRQR